MIAKILQYKHRLTIPLLTIIIFLGLLYNISSSNAQGQEFSINLPNRYPILEYTDNFGQNINTDEVNIPLPSNQWNITDIELNFTDIGYIRELETIEDINYSSASYRIDKNNLARAVQINITEPTIIFKTYIFGNVQNVATTTTLTTEIRGYDYITNKPNATIYGSTELNISTVSKWYIQNFSSPIHLSKGYYYLVINGINMFSADTALYWWNYTSNPTNPNLYTWNYDKINLWKNGITGQPFLYKLDQRVNKSYYPEDINLKIRVNEIDYDITNGTEVGTGKVNINDINFSPNLDLLSLSVLNSQSLDLYYNISYYAKFKHLFFSSGQVILKEDSDNIWHVNPQINKVFNNYSIEFVYPKSWSDLTLFRDEENKTSEIIFQENSLLILNSSILPSSTWLFTANSPNINFSLNFPITSWKTGQELEFSLQQPVIPGSYTFKLYNSIGEKFNVTKEIPSEGNSFSYEIPSNAIEGLYTAFILFNNGTDAGIASQEFKIIAVSSGPLESPIILIVSLILIISVAVGISSYVAYKKFRVSYKGKMKNVLNQCLDVMNLEYVIVLDAKSGIDVFSLSFGGKEVDATLISGFLHALRNFGTEVLEGVRESRTIKVEYKKSIILMTEFVNLRLVIIMKSNPSKNFLYSIESLAYDIYKKYGKLVDNFNGNLKEFRGIKELVEKNLNLSFIYPLTIVMSEKVRLTPAEKAMVDRAKTFMKTQNFNYFYTLYLMPENICTPKDAKTIISLINKKVFRPLEKTIE